MADDKAKAILKRYERLKGDRGTTESHWQQCGNYGDPNRADFITERAVGAKRMQYIFDQTPIWAREQFVAGMHSLMTSSTIQWFFLRTQNEALNRNANVKAWLDTASAELYRIFNSSRHNFASQVQQLYSDQGLIGTGCMAVLESRKSGILFSTHHMKECVLSENEEDRIDTNIRRWQYTAEQAWGMWGKAAGEKIEKAMEDGKPDDKFWFLHSVTPRRNRDPRRADNRNMAWESCYYFRKRPEHHQRKRLPGISLYHAALLQGHRRDLWPRPDDDGAARCQDADGAEQDHRSRARRR
jgi:hypothetical protein